ncbi:MAG: (2Fe-2S)-binding protein [Bdellovibrionota bacterium]
MAAPQLKNAQQNARSINIEVSLPARDRLTLELEVDRDEVKRAQLVVVGCTEILKLAQEWRPKLKGPLAQIPLPEGTGHAVLMLREAILKARGEWKFPYTDEELCHCRAVATSKVDAAIVGGCHSMQAVAQETSAGTSCGTCRVDTDAIIKYRLGR